MQTRDHKILAKFWAAEMGEIPCLYKRAFIIGNIEPDWNPFTYLHGMTQGERFHGHNYENILQVMRKLFNSVQKRELPGIRNYYRLGKLTHYVADAFTYPYNQVFAGSLREHCRYESVLHEKIGDALQKQKNMERNRDSAANFQWIETLHGNYLKEAGSYDIDCRYILKATAMLLKEERYSARIPARPEQSKPCPRARQLHPTSPCM